MTNGMVLENTRHIMGELGNGVDGSHFANDLARYITPRNQRVKIKALQGITNKLDAWAGQQRED